MCGWESQRWRLGDHLGAGSPSERFRCAGSSPPRCIDPRERRYGSIHLGGRASPPACPRQARTTEAANALALAS